MTKSIFNSVLFATRFLFTGPVFLWLMFLFSFHTAISSVLPHCSNAQSISHSLHIKTRQDLWFVMSVPSVLSVPYVLSVVFLSRDSIHSTPLHSTQHFVRVQCYLQLWWYFYFLNHCSLLSYFLGGRAGNPPFLWGRASIPAMPSKSKCD